MKKGKAYSDSIIVDVELEAYKKSDALEYLFYVYQFCKTLKENNILYSVRLDDYPSYMMEILEVDSLLHFRSELQSYKYNRGKKNRFSIYIPNGKKDDVINLFCDITDCALKPEDTCKVYFGKNNEYQIDLIQHTYLSMLSRINKDAIKDIHPNDEAVIKYMLQEDNSGYYMPNLYKCVLGDLDLWYSLINAVKPKNIDDLQRISSLLSSVFNNRKLLVRQIKEYGLKNIICCREQLYQVLCDGYDIPIERVDGIRLNLNHLHRLSESDELILQSNEVPDYIIEQLNNIYYLAFAVHSSVTVELIYQLAYIKFYYRDDFINSLPSLNHQAYVGPFFYIDECVHATTDSIKEFDYDLRFFDSKASHYIFFYSLQMDGDFGNYPRGRVIYDNYHQQFIVYLDKTLMKKDIEKKIMSTYFLEEEKVVFKSDSHYTHDGL